MRGDGRGTRVRVGPIVAVVVLFGVAAIAGGLATWPFGRYATEVCSPPHRVEFRTNVSAVSRHCAFVDEVDGRERAVPYRCGIEAGAPLFGAVRDVLFVRNRDDSGPTCVYDVALGRDIACVPIVAEWSAGYEDHVSLGAHVGSIIRVWDIDRPSGAISSWELPSSAWVDTSRYGIPAPYVVTTDDPPRILRLIRGGLEPVTPPSGYHGAQVLDGGICFVLDSTPPALGTFGLDFPARVELPWLRGGESFALVDHDRLGFVLGVRTPSGLQLHALSPDGAERWPARDLPVAVTVHNFFEYIEVVDASGQRHVVDRATGAVTEGGSR